MKNAQCFVPDTVSSANTPAAIPIGPNPGTPNPYIFTTGSLNNACNISYIHHTPKQRIFTINFAKNVHNERKYK